MSDYHTVIINSNGKNRTLSCVVLFIWITLYVKKILHHFTWKPCFPWHHAGLSRMQVLQMQPMNTEILSTRWVFFSGVSQQYVLQSRNRGTFSPEKSGHYIKYKSLKTAPSMPSQGPGPAWSWPSGLLYECCSWSSDQDLWASLTSQNLTVQTSISKCLLSPLPVLSLH